MKKFISISVAAVLMMALSTIAFAMDMNHSGHGEGAMAGSMSDGISMMEKGLAQMKHGADLMRNPVTMSDGMGLMNKEMMPMHNGMQMIEKGAEGSSHYAMIKNHMGTANKGMMEMMKGMGLVKKGDVAGFQMMSSGVEKMEKALDAVKAMAGM